MPMAEAQFDADPASLRKVRSFVRDTLPGLPHLDEVVLGASELATNVVRHARTRYTVRLGLDDTRVRLEVSDGSSIVPAVEDLTESQRGLRVIDLISRSWGVDAADTGKTVWVEFPRRGRSGS